MAENWRTHDAYYGARHRELRRTLTAQVATGTVSCARCGEAILSGEEWDLGHVDDAGPTAYAGPEHRRCNRATAQHAYQRRLRDSPPDDPVAGVYWGPAGRRWSRPWLSWRS
jgi:hypothetical protein